MASPGKYTMGCIVGGGALARGADVASAAAGEAGAPAAAAPLSSPMRVLRFDTLVEVKVPASELALCAPAPESLSSLVAQLWSHCAPPSSSSGRCRSAGRYIKAVAQRVFHTFHTLLSLRGARRALSLGPLGGSVTKAGARVLRRRSATPGQHSGNSLAARTPSLRASARAAAGEGGATAAAGRLRTHVSLAILTRILGLPKGKQPHLPMCALLSVSILGVIQEDCEQEVGGPWEGARESL